MLKIYQTIIIIVTVYYVLHLMEVKSTDLNFNVFGVLVALSIIDESSQ